VLSSTATVWNYRDGLGDLELCRSLTGLFNPIHDRRCFNCTQAGSIIPKNERLRSATPKAKTAKVSPGFVLLHQLGGLGLPIGPVGCQHPEPLDCFPELVSVVSGRRDPAISSRSYSSSHARRLRRHAQLSGEEDGPCRHGDHALHGPINFVSSKLVHRMKAPAITLRCAGSSEHQRNGAGQR
jgi:hypothetical protein